MRRRDAIKGAAFGALAGKALVPGAEANARASANDRIGIGMIGVGNFGRANLRQVLKHPDCLRSRKRPIAEIEDGYRAHLAGRLGNIACRLGRTLHWDATREEIEGDAEANRLAVGEYREPWRPKGLETSAL